MENSLIPKAATDFRAVLGQNMNALKNFLGDEKRALHFMSSVMSSFQKIPKLLECTQSSLMGAFMEAAAAGLYPSDYSGDCYVIPYRDRGVTKAQFQMGYKGFKTLAYRSGVRRLGTDVVREKDTYKEERGTTQKIKHVVPPSGDRGAAYRAYAWAELENGEVIFRSMSRDEILQIAKKSKSFGSEYSPWDERNDPELWMWQKTVFKQLAKMLPTSQTMERAVYADNVSEKGGHTEYKDGSFVDMEQETTSEYFDAVVETIGNAKAEELALIVGSLDHSKLTQSQEVDLLHFLAERKKVLFAEKQIAETVTTPKEEQPQEATATSAQPISEKAKEESQYSKRNVLRIMKNLTTINEFNGLRDECRRVFNAGEISKEEFFEINAEIQEKLNEISGQTSIV